ncbi:MAG: PD-(D/E)XK nuclease family protein [Clostridia bacterium]|nr:PD-(D/E)XK nuclease family protein [Clostridia bacterium]
MLQFVLGRASSGKTYWVTEKIAGCIAQGENPVLLVPEQFSFESEKNVLDRVGDGAAQRVSVISFTRLCDEVERIAGGVCGESITDADRVILMSRALNLCRDDLKRFKKYVSSKSFASLMIDTVGEFKMNFISAEDLRYAADNADDEQLKLKLLDTALIYENYDMIVAEKFIDNTDRLTKLYYALENYRYFENKTVFIDSFKGFSGQQYKILERIVSQASSVTVTLTDNPADTRDFGLFSNIKRVKNRIASIARKFSVRVAEDMVLDRKNYAYDDLTALEDFMATGKTDFDGKCDNIAVCRADSVYSEADFVARNIRRIVREKGARYSDFVIIARDTAPYEDALEVACKKNNISCFIDRRMPLVTLPTASAVLAAANVAKSFSTENILRFHKSGLDILSLDEIATLENYTYLWNIDGALWKNEWTMDPDGFMADGELSVAKRERLTVLNELRKKAIDPLVTLKDNFKGNAKNMAGALVRLLDDTNAAERLKSLSKQYGDTLYRDAVRKSWDSVMKILNSLAVCFGEAEIKGSEFCEALRSALSLETVGVIPQMMDEAIFGAADRIRPSRPKYAFIMGANQGVFPRLEQKSGLFSNSEREKLISLEIDIPDKTFSLAVDEESLLYSNVCCASHGVFISYTATFDGATAAEPSAFVGDIQDNFDCEYFTEPFALQDDYLPESREDTFSLLCGSLSKENKDTKTLIKALEESEYTGRIDTVLQSRSRVIHSISDDTAKQLFGDRITMSPSKFDTFNRCRFMYFCRYGLRVERLQPAEFNAMQRGTVVHYVLQRVVEEHGKNLSQFEKSEISNLVEKYTKEYLDMIAGFSDIETPYLKYLISTIKRTLKYVVERLALEFAQSDFTPVKCELRIGYDGDLPEIKIPIENSGTLELIGVVDRLDTWNGYIRIIDYKTGHRDFKLPDILFGQNMQMLIYLYAVARSEQFGARSAGILYMPASRDKNDSKSARRMNGLIAADEALITAMDKENKGEFVPKFSEKSPSDSFIKEEDFIKIFEFIENKLKRTGSAIYGGDIAADPVDGLDSGACKYCEYQSVCRIGDEAHVKVPKLTNAEVLEEIERQVTGDGV